MVKLNVYTPLSLHIVKLFTDTWTNGGVEKPKVRSWVLPRDSQVWQVFQHKFDSIQDQLEDLCGTDDLLTGVISKSKGQILRLAAVFNALFSLDPNHPMNDNLLSTASFKAAINFVETCNEHTAIIGGRKTVTEPLSRK